MPLEDPIARSYRCQKVRQPLGEFYITSMPARDIIGITHFDVRRILMEERDVERYLGIQRPLIPRRVKEIAEYVTTYDAVFPTGVIVAVDAKCAVINEDENEITLTNYLDDEDEDNNILFYNIARVLDGQHRLAGLEEAIENKGFREDFEINVSIFVGADIADQANIFATVNLAQTKVAKSLAYDLYDLMQSRSPQRVCHNIAVALDSTQGSPFYKRIKRLGVATIGRQGETITQSTFIEPLMVYLTTNPVADRDLYLRGKQPQKCDLEDLVKHPLQHMFVEERDYDITDLIWNYFEAIQRKWPNAWNSRERGNMLNRTNGYRALMRLFRPLYLSLTVPGRVVSTDSFYQALENVPLEDGSFNTDRYQPGSAGESQLYRDLRDAIGLSDDKRELVQSLQIGWERR